MTYEFDPEYRFDEPVSDGAKGEVIEFALGFDPDTDLVVLMSVMLVATDKRETMEFCFGIRTRIGDGPASEPDYSKETVDRYIPKIARPIIKETIRRCIARLVPSSMPENIIMETYYPDLEPKALEKYQPICRAIVSCGYVIDDEFRDPDSGIDFWLFGRKVEESPP